MAIGSPPIAESFPTLQIDNCQLEGVPRTGVNSQHDTAAESLTISEHSHQLTIAYGLGGESERAVLTHLARRAQEGAERGARQRASDTHALDSEC